MTSEQIKQVSRKVMEGMKNELDYLKKTKRREVAEKLRQAISFGDLKENAAYHEAKEDQAFLEGKIIELSNTIKNSVITERVPNKNIVSVGSGVKIRTESGEEEEYLIVNSTESDPLKGMLSAGSPMGKALIGKVRGEKCFLETPSGKKIEMEILKIE